MGEWRRYVLVDLAERCVKLYLPRDIAKAEREVIRLNATAEATAK